MLLATKVNVKSTPDGSVAPNDSEVKVSTSPTAYPEPVEVTSIETIVVSSDNVNVNAAPVPDPSDDA